MFDLDFVVSCFFLFVLLLKKRYLLCKALFLLVIIKKTSLWFNLQVWKFGSQRLNGLMVLFG